VGLPEAASLPEDMLLLVPPVPPDEPLAPVPLEEDMPVPDEPVPVPPLEPTEAPPDVRGVTWDPLWPDIDEPAFGGLADVPDDEVPADEPVPELLVPGLLVPEPEVPAPAAPDPVVPELAPLPVVPEPEVCAMGAVHHSPAISAVNATILYWCFIFESPGRFTKGNPAKLKAIPERLCSLCDLLPLSAVAHTLESTA
jgi:hypothetical protein